MRPSELTARMRRLEAFHGLRVPDGAFAVLRVDGRGFTRFTAGRCEKPFDARFHGWMVAAAEALLLDLGGVFACTHSDEISVLLPRTWAVFDRGVEKAVSVAAGSASATFTLACGAAAHFDGRAVVLATAGQVADYFRWRQADAGRCCLNGWCYWTRRHAGDSPRAATAAVAGLRVAGKNELLFRRGVNFNDLPAWQKRGTGLYFADAPHAGRDPRTGADVPVARRRLRTDPDLPLGAGYGALVRELVGE